MAKIENEFNALVGVSPSTLHLPDAIPQSVFPLEERPLGLENFKPGILYKGKDLSRSDLESPVVAFVLLISEKAYIRLFSTKSA